MKKKLLSRAILPFIFAALFVGGCAQKDAQNDKKGDEEMTKQEEGIAEAIEQETSDVGGEINEAN